MSDAEDILNDSPKDTTSSPSQRSSESQGSTPDEASPSHKESAVSLQEQRNKRSSVYVYLAVLFGAAFLMLLLAYLVQQRNNAMLKGFYEIAITNHEGYQKFTKKKKSNG